MIIETIILTGISAIAMVALAVITYRYAKSTRLIAEANTKMIAVTTTSTREANPSWFFLLSPLIMVFPPKSKMVM